MKTKNRTFFRFAALFPVLVTALLIPPAFADDPYAAQPGSLDLLFGEWGLGIATMPTTGYEASYLHSLNNTYAHSLSTDTTGRIIVGGTGCISGDCEALLLRFDAEGAPDLSGDFSNGGVIRLDEIDSPSDAVVLVTRGSSDDTWASWIGADGNWHLVKIDSEGVFAEGFGAGDISHDAGSNMNVALLPRPGDEKLVAVTSGYFQSPLVFHQYLAADGSLDPTFGDGGDGELVLDTGDAFMSSMSSQLLADGRVVTLVDSWTESPYLLMLNPDGSGLDVSFGDNGKLALSPLVEGALLARNIDTSDEEFSFSAGAFALAPDGNLRLGATACCLSNGNSQSLVFAVTPEGTLDTTFADNGVSFPIFERPYLSVRALSVRDDGAMTLQLTAVEDSNLLNLLDSFIFLDGNGGTDGRYGGGDGVAEDVMFPGSAPLFAGGGPWPALPHAYDADGALLFIHSTLDETRIVGVNGLGVARLLPPDEAPIYDLVPAPMPDSTLSVPENVEVPLAVLELGDLDMNVATSVRVENGKIVLAGETDVNAEETVIMPLGMYFDLRQRTASNPGTRTETTLFLNGEQYVVLATETNADRDAQQIEFAPREDAPLETFVTSSPHPVTGIDVAIDVTVENGCYYLFMDLADIPETLDPTGCLTSVGQVEPNQLIVLGHVSADTISTETITTIHIGGGTATFTSTTTSVPSEPLPDSEADDITFTQRNGVEASTFVVSTPALVSGINTSIPMSVENGCYFLFDNSESVPGVFPEGECKTAAIEVTDGQAIVLGHTSASTPETQTVTTLHYGAASTQFVSVTAAITEPEPEDSGGGPFAPLMLFMLAVAGIFRRRR